MWRPKWPFMFRHVFKRSEFSRMLFPHLCELQNKGPIIVYISREHPFATIQLDFPKGSTHQGEGISHFENITPSPNGPNRKPYFPSGELLVTSHWHQRELIISLPRERMASLRAREDDGWKGGRGLHIREPLPLLGKWLSASLQLQSSIVRA